MRPILAILLASAGFAALGAPARAEPVAMQPLQLAGMAEEGFLEGRAERLAVLGSAQASGGVGQPVDGPLADALLDLATFYLAHAFVLEGLSVVEALDDVPLEAHQDARRRLLHAAFVALDDRGGADIEAAAAVLGEAAPIGHARLLLAHAQARLGQAEASAATLSEAVDDLPAFPPGLARRVLPQLLEAAITAEDWALARRVAEELSRHASPGDGALPFFLGEVARGGGDLLLAFDRYVEAASARDVWGHRARLAIVDLAFETEAVDAAEAHDMLVRVYALWRGDTDAGATLLLMERMALEAGRTIDAALALGEFLVRHADIPEAEAATDRALAMIEAYYAEGGSGGIPLDEFLAGHRAIANVFRFFPGYEDASASYADHMRSIGATAAAAQEYRLTREYLEAAGDLGLRDPDPARLDELRLKEAEARLSGGQWDEAEALLAVPLLSPDADLATRLASLRTRLFDATGILPDAAEATALPRTETFVRLLAELHAAEGSWEEARSAYAELWAMLGDEMPLADAAGLLVAAYRAGDADLVAAAETLLSQRGGVVADIVDAGFAPPSLAGTGLGADAARVLLERADRAIDIARGNGEGDDLSQE
jgi:hypothetical protein